MFASLLYLALLRLLTLVAPSYRSDDAAQIEILVLRHELGVFAPAGEATGLPEPGPGAARCSKQDPA
jgi:hypothetical protein